MLELRRNPPLEAPLLDALVQLWTDVSNAGGAVGFVPPVTPEAVRPVAEGAFDRVRSGADDLVVAFERQRPIGLGFLATNSLDLHRHRGTVKRLQRHPDHPGAGVGGAVLDELEAAARGRGLDLLTLTVRGGTGLEGFYLARGYRLDAGLPARLRMADGDFVEELHLSKPLTEAGARRVSASLSVHRLDPDLPLPARARPGDAGLDLHARQDVLLEPGQRALVPTGIAVALPSGHVGLVHPRSGLAARHGVGMVNAPGTIDEGYRGEIQVILINHDPSQAVRIRRGERIAQLVVQRVEEVRVVEVAELPPSARGTGGFGSTGR